MRNSGKPADDWLVWSPALPWRLSGDSLPLEALPDGIGQDGKGVAAVGGQGGVPASDPGGGCVAEDADGGDEGDQPEGAAMGGLDDGDADGDEPGAPGEADQREAAQGAGETPSKMPARICQGAVQ
jgi:hypothetical protein